MKATPLSQGQTAALCREFSLLLRAGLTLSGSAFLLLEEPGQPREVLAMLAQELERGAPLAEAMEATRAFPAAVSGMAAIGEATGRLEEALEALADYYEEKESLAHEIRTALWYPGLILLLMLGVIGVLLVCVLPVFDSVYAAMGGSLTGLSAGLLRLGQLLRGCLPGLLAVMAAAAAAAAAVILCPKLRQKAAQLWNRWFGDRGIARKFANARILKGLSMGIRSGLTEEEAMALTLGLLTDTPGALQRIRDGKQALEEGASLSRVLADAGLISAAQERLLRVGSRSGNSDRILDRIAQDAGTDARRELEALVSKAEPAMVLLASGLVGVILLSAVLPLMNILASLG